MAEDERQIRIAAETLVRGSLNSQHSCTQHNIMRTSDIILTEDLLAGAMQNGKMSHVRRFFCLFVTFDLLLTFLMWLICTMIAGESLEIAFSDQIVHYNIKTSLFDIVMAAICRFTVLLLFYGLLYLNHWCIVALSTASTSAFLIAKVFLFDWSTCSQPVFQVLLILSSFVLAWVEAWFFDIRVLPQETQAKNWFRHFVESEREPLLRNTVSERRQYSSVEPTGVFFTPVDSPVNSEDEEDARTQGSSRRLSRASEIFLSRPLPRLAREKIDEYKRIAATLLENCQALLISTEWQIETIMPNQDVVFYMDRPKEGRIVKIVGMIDAPAKVLVDRLFDDIETVPTWNKLVTESSKLQEIDEHTDIAYQVTSPQGGGIVGARDFIILRHRNRCGHFYVNAGTSVALASLPARKNIVRAENRISCFATEDLPNEENKCRFTWILSTNLKGWLPQKIVDKSMSSALVDFMTYLRKHLDNIKNSPTS